MFSRRHSPRDSSDARDSGNSRHPSDQRGQPKPSQRGRLFREWHVEATVFLLELVRAADCLKDARAFDGTPALHYGPRWQLLRAIERCGGAPSFADLGRLLGISRQAARESAIKAATAGVLELLPSPDDRRTLQVILTPAGRRELEAQRLPEFSWLFALLNGLEPAAMHSTHHVLAVVRRRLEREARAMRAAFSPASARRSRRR